jgi:alcohol dehydrogenase, propanol-preferring
MTRSRTMILRAVGTPLDCLSRDVPEPDAALVFALVFAPVGAAVPLALKPGRVVCDGMRMSDMPAFLPAVLREEQSTVRVTNLTPADGNAFFPLARAAGVRADPLEAANRAPDAPGHGRLEGAAVLVPR